MFISLLIWVFFSLGIILIDHGGNKRFSAGKKELFIRAQSTFKSSSPYKHYLTLMDKKKRRVMEDDLLQALSYIRGLLILEQGSYISSEVLLSELSSVSASLSDVFENMAHALRENDIEKAGNCLYEAVRTDNARDIGSFLVSWDDADPGQLLSSVELYMSRLKEEKQTRQMAKDEALSDIVYFPVVVNSMLVLINFVYIAYFLQEQEALQFMLGV